MVKLAESPLFLRAVLRRRLIGGRGRLLVGGGGGGGRFAFVNQDEDECLSYAENRISVSSMTERNTYLEPPSMLTQFHKLLFQSLLLCFHLTFPSLVEPFNFLMF